MTQTATPAPVRWGILSTANIAAKAFIPAVHELGGTISVVGSRDLSRAQGFAGEHGIGRAVGSYDEVINADDVDVIYVPLPNNLHATYSAQALRAGKPVFCEKPLTRSEAETRELIEVSQTTGVYLWETFVFAFAEQTRRLMDLYAGGVIGTVTGVDLQFSFELKDQDNIRLASELAGGALYDVGCYPLRFAQLLLGNELELTDASAVLAPTGVDAQIQATLRNTDGVIARISAAIDRPPAVEARITGERGTIVVPDPYHPLGYTVDIQQTDDVWTVRSSGGQFSFGPAIAHIEAVLRGAASPLHLAADEAAPTARLIDAIRAEAQLG